MITPTPELLTIMTELTETYGQEEWWGSIGISDDDAGARIEIKVKDESFVPSGTDTLPRLYKNVGVVVIRRPSNTFQRN